MRHLPSFRLSTLTLALGFAGLHTPTLAADAQLDKQQKVERISVYGQHNQLILNSGTATKSDMELMEIPAALVVVSKELIDLQGTTNLQDAIRNVSGLTQAGNNYGVGDNLVIRGLGVNYTYDGMYGGAGLDNVFNPTRSMTNVESIEVLKGPATGLYGMGSAGGIINLVEKRAQFESAYQVQASVGQWDSQQIMLDATAPLSDTLAYRVVANYETTDGYRSLGEERSEIYTNLLWETSQAHTLSLTGAYVKDRMQIDSVGDPVRILNHDSVTGDATDWNNLLNDTDSDNDEKLGIQLSDEQRQALANSITSVDGYHPYALNDSGLISPLSEPNKGEELRIKLKSELAIGDNGHLIQQLQYRDYESEFVRQTGAYNYVYWDRLGEINAAPRAPLVVDDVIYPYAARRQEYRRQWANETSWQYFADLKLDWSLGGITGEHLFSANYEDRDIRLKSWSIYDADGTNSDNPVPYILDIRNPNWPTGEFDDYDPTLRTNYNKKVEAWGISFQEVVYFNDQLTGRFGGAYTGIKETYQHLGTDRVLEVGQEADTDDNGHTYNLGLNYRFIPEFAAFVNVSKGMTAYSITGSLTVNGDNRPPSESESLDLGVRFTALDEDLIGSLVWFDTRRTNLRYANDAYNDNPEDEDFNISVPQYFYDDEDKTRGYELDLNLDINESWSMNLNATYQKAQNIRGGGSPEPSKGIPKRFASLWSQYTHSFSAVPGEFGFNLGVTYEDERTVNSTSFGLPQATIGSYSRWDAAVRYEYEGWKVQLNLNNLFDKEYYSNALFLGGLPGESRNARLTVNYAF